MDVYDVDTRSKDEVAENSELYVTGSEVCEVGLPRNLDFSSRPQE